MNYKVKQLTPTCWTVLLVNTSGPYYQPESLGHYESKASAMSAKHALELKEQRARINSAMLSDNEKDRLINLYKNCQEYYD